MFTAFLGIVAVLLVLRFLVALSFGEFSLAAIFICLAAIFICLAAVVGYSCYYRVVQPDPPPTPEQVAAAEKRKAKIEEAKIPTLFSQTSDGCSVYKFVDNGYNHYFTRCGRQVSTDSTYRSGKSTKVETIQTNQEQAK